MTTWSAVNRFLAQRRLALAGASRNGRSFGNTVFKELTKKGYDVTLLHPEVTEIAGQACYPTVADLPEEVGGLLLVVPPGRTHDLVRQAAAAGIRHVWMQQGSESAEAVAFCRENGINEVHGECILMFAEPTGFHKFHRWIWRIIGKLPEASS